MELKCTKHVYFFTVIFSMHIFCSNVVSFTSCTCVIGLFSNTTIYQQQERTFNFYSSVVILCSHSAADMYRQFND